jgi:hypothetical protein
VPTSWDDVQRRRDEGNDAIRARVASVPADHP